MSEIFLLLCVICPVNQWEQFYECTSSSYIEHIEWEEMAKVLVSLGVVLDHQGAP